MPYDGRMTAMMRACEVVGGVGKLARMLAVADATVTQWRNGQRPVPLERCIAIERATAGAVTRKDLRPDDWPEIWPEAAQPDWRPVGAAEPVTAGEG